MSGTKCHQNCHQNSCGLALSDLEIQRRSVRGRFRNWNPWGRSNRSDEFMGSSACRSYPMAQNLFGAFCHASGDTSRRRTMNRFGSRSQGRLANMPRRSQRCSVQQMSSALRAISSALERTTSSRIQWAVQRPSHSLYQPTECSLSGS
jgi:hypothetical protein